MQQRHSLEVGKPAQATPTKRGALGQRSMIVMLGAVIVALFVTAGGAWYFLVANTAVRLSTWDVRNRVCVAIG
jgi:flagellar basal body-associated protein FliL